MCYLNKSKLSLCVIFLFISISFDAKSSWKNLTESEYLEKLVDCRTQIKKLQWKNTLWPKENADKPAFSEVINLDELRSQTILNLKQQYLLADKFNIEVDGDLLQSDIDRMSNNSKDPEALKEVYQLLNNDPESVAVCLSRPYLVLNILENEYFSTYELHADLKLKAQQELNKYLDSPTVIPAHATLSEITYVIDDNHDKADRQENFEVVIAIRRPEFEKRLKELSHQAELQESKTAYIYTELVSHSETELKIKSMVWHKKPLVEWVESLKYDNFPIILPDYKPSLKLTDINKGSDSEIEYSSVSNSWNLPTQPTARYLHSVVWTGSEMIIWGGSVSDTDTAGGKYNPTTDTWEMVSPINGPVDRIYHSAIWTGSEMIIWGGFPSQVDNQGKRYNPILNTWTDMSTTDAPKARDQHSTIWTGEKMIIWGGRVPEDDFDSSDSGGIYDPISDTWTTTSLTNSPLSRYYHTAVWTGSEMIVWGGWSRVEGVLIDYLETGSKYNPNTDEWVRISDNPLTSRRGHEAVWSGEEMMIWAGGGIGFDSRVHLYNPATDFWRVGSESIEPEDRDDFSMVWTGTDLLVWGGTGCEKLSNGSYECGRLLNSGLKYNPVNDNWAELSEVFAPNNREHHSAIWTGTEMIVWGGQSDVFPLRFNNGGRYDPVDDSWTRLIATPFDSIEARNSHSSVWTGSHLLVWGGRGKGSSQIQSGGKYSLTTDSWEHITTASSPTARSSHTTIWTGNEMIVWGGTLSNSYEDTGGRYDSLNNMWQPTSLTDAPVARRGHEAVWTGEEMVIWGGGSAEGGINSGSKYNPFTDQWNEISDLNAPIARFYCDSVWTGSEMIIWGGTKSGVDLSTGGRYNPKTDSWNAMTETDAPAGRKDLHMIWSGNEVLVWGGRDDELLNTGSRYNPVNDSWFSMTTLNAPEPRAYNSTIWTGSEMVIWGGLINGNTDTGGSYNPIKDRWISTSLNWAPQARVFHSANWTGSEMIIWGGWIGTRHLNTMGVYKPFAEGIYRNGFE